MSLQEGVVTVTVKRFPTVVGCRAVEGGAAEAKQGQEKDEPAAPPVGLHGRSQQFY